MPRERGLNNQPEWLTAKEAADLLGVRTATVYAYASRGLLGAGKKGKYPRALVEVLKRKAAARSGHGAVAAGALRWGEPVLDSSITQLTPRGPVYRGRRAIDLVEKPYERVAELLWGLSDREFERSSRGGSLDEDSSSAESERLPLTLTLSRRGGRGDQHRGSSAPVDWTARVPSVRTQSVRPSLHAWLEVVIGLAPRLQDTDWRVAGPALIHRLACSAGPHEREAEQHASIVDAVGVSLLGRELKKNEAKLINACLVLMADHELNPSTFSARVAASAGAPWLDCIIAALGSSAGTRHASACDDAERFWRSALSSREAAKTLVARALEGGRAIPGFEAGAYPQGDPRAEKLLSLLKPQLTPATHKRVDDVLGAVDDATGQLPAVDSALALTGVQLGLPQRAPTALFVLGRTAGWFAHIEEQQLSADPIRPRARFVAE